MRPHTSAGRVPTEKGLRLFVDGLLEIGELAPDERVAIEARMSGSGRGIEDVLTQATQLLSGLSRCAGLMVTAKQDAALKHVEFVARRRRARRWSIMVSEDGQVENRVIDTPPGLPVSALSEASQLSECAAARPHPGRGARRNPGRAGRRTRRTRRADRQDRGRGPGHPGRPGAASTKRC